MFVFGVYRSDKSINEIKLNVLRVHAFVDVRRTSKQPRHHLLASKFLQCCGETRARVCLKSGG